MNIQKLDHTEALRNVHHSVNSPLTSIFNLTEILLLGIEGDMSAEIRKDVQTIAEDAHHLHRALESILEFIGLVTETRSFQSIDISKLIHSVLKDSGSLISTSITTEPVIVMGDERTLQIIFQKLVDYLIRKEGSRNLVINAEPQQGNLFVFSISPKETVASKNDPRAYTPYKPGIDLLLCEQLLRLHGGKLWFDMADKEQKTVCFSLPKSL